MSSLQVGRREDPHHTREQIEGYFRDAEAIVADAELGEDLRVPAFLKAVELLAAKQITFEHRAVGALGILQPPSG